LLFIERRLISFIRKNSKNRNLAMVIEGGGGVSAVLLPALEAVLELWRSRYAAEPFPLRTRIAPADLARWESHAAWIEAGPGGGHRIQRFGPGLIRRCGRESTGHYVEDLASDIARSLGAKLERAGETLSPAIGGASVRLGRDAALFCEIVLPLARDMARATQFLLVSYELRNRR
jgi:hypothetical protein